MDADIADAWWAWQLNGAIRLGDRLSAAGTTIPAPMPRHRYVLPERWVQQRQQQFLAGRFAAEAACEQLGVEPHEVASGSAREPCFAAGLTGSIAHHEARAMAVVGQRYIGIGVDVERISPVSKELWPMILADGEGADSQLSAATTFSAKEAVFKATFGLVGRVFDFKAVRLQVQDRFFRAEPAHDDPTLEPVRRGDGVIVVRGDEVATLFLIDEVADG